MKIRKEQNGTAMTLFLSGQLDAKTAPELDHVVQEELSGITELVLDLAELEYIASAGLRVFLTATKLMRSQGKMKLVHVNKEVMEILRLAGFVRHLNIEE